VVALFVALLATGGADAVTLPSIYVDYSDSCTFTMRADGGITLAAASAPGPTVPPGVYQIVLTAPKNAPSCPMDFQLSGPGVNLVWEFGGEALDSMATETLLPSSTYTATDLRSSSPGYVVFSTSATGSSSSLVTQTPTTAGGKGQTVQGVVGTALSPYRGTVHVTVPRSGALRMTARGRRVTRLQPGRYKAVVADDSPRRGLAVRSASGRERTLTSLAFTGSRTLTVSLPAGASFAATP
jgi:hypothetical protein